jgi:Tfp pilus assembly protein PilF
LAKLNRLDEAADELRLAIAKDPSYAEAHNKLALVYARQEKFDAALEQIAEAQRIEPRNASFIRNEAALLLQTGKNEQAKNRLLAALEFNRGDAETYATLADAYIQLGEYPAAEEAYRNALRFAPGMGPVRANLAHLLMNREAYAEADELLVATADPDVLMAEARLAWALATHRDDKVRDGAKAVAHAERVRKHFGDKQARGLDILAAAYAEAGRFDDAVTTANLAVAAAAEAKDDKLAAAVKQRLAAYREKKPFRDAALAKPSAGE